MSRHRNVRSMNYQDGKNTLTHMSHLKVNPLSCNLNLQSYVLAE